MIEKVPHAALGSLSQLGVPFKFSNCGGDIRRAPPMLGEHTDEVLGSLLKRSPEDIAALRGKKVI